MSGTQLPDSSSPIRVKKTFLAYAVAVLTAAATGIPAAATPADSQHLRGMAERSFLVQVSLPDGTPLFPNCSALNADGSCDGIDNTATASGTDCTAAAVQGSFSTATASTDGCTALAVGDNEVDSC